ncbi:MAG TPA: hypothetical protein DHW82_12370 [Spirochaetia bacterium]|nr:MAG: hypothetical protein A2Y41_02780 [Spirochaetes bacterium GWB1_36_13]HCL57786.1 hypothetical protein [Spirochaetia bacterium]
MKKLPLILIFVFLASFIFSQEKTEKNIFLSFFLSFMKPSQSEKLVWHDFNQGVAKGIAEKKPIVISFYTDWCPYCKKMEAEVFNSPKIKPMFQNDFIPVRLNGEDLKYTIRYQEKTYTVEQFLYSLQIQGFPSTGFLDSKGTIITVIPGFIPADVFESLLLYMKESCYEKSMPLEEFMKKANSCAQ